MYLLYFETADVVDIYYYSDDSNYDDEKLSDNIYNGTWYVNPLSANPQKWSNLLSNNSRLLPTNYLSVFDHFGGLALKGLINDVLLLLYYNISIKIMGNILYTNCHKGLPFE